jgi:hypothetical protein
MNTESKFTGALPDHSSWTTFGSIRTVSPDLNDFAAWGAISIDLQAGYDLSL